MFTKDWGPGCAALVHEEFATGGVEVNALEELAARVPNVGIAPKRWLKAKPQEDASPWHQRIGEEKMIRVKPLELTIFFRA